MIPDAWACQLPRGAAQAGGRDRTESRRPEAWPCKLLSELSRKLCKHILHSYLLVRITPTIFADKYLFSILIRQHSYLQHRDAYFNYVFFASVPFFLVLPLFLINKLYFLEVFQVHNKTE